jgi:hypothetical protein
VHWRRPAANSASARCSGARPAPVPGVAGFGPCSTRRTAGTPIRRTPSLQIVANCPWIVFGSRYRIGSAGVPWVTPKNALDRQPASARCSVPDYGSPGVLRTRRIETAMCADPRAEQELIQPDERQTNRAHQQVSRRSFSNSRRAADRSNGAGPGRTRTTISTDPS